ncbi:Werner Syndrome-like exonuclease [Mangifera indica]|uniref:Werner Syndrome-like exonuclease n=1 Tax=Mangifera indica TaxID=29780 RepID=UPI001CFBA1FD|nr:Werner Syndrome-like exonuclease [Mangifera indica]
MTIEIHDHRIRCNTHRYFDVIFYNDTILTLVTHTPAMVDFWISDIQRIHQRRLRRLIVGLDTEWRPNFWPNEDNPIAILQLCVGHRCLIFQLMQAPGIPQSLVNFLTNGNYSFVGVGIHNDVEKLYENYQLHVVNVFDLRDWAVECTGDQRLRRAGLKRLALAIMGKDIQKPASVTMSWWDNPWLAPLQVQYACIDSFVSFEIGRICRG